MSENIDQASPLSEVEDFATSDMRVIVTFMTLGIPFISTELKSGMNTPRRTVFHYNLKDSRVKEILEKRRNGEAIPVGSIECVFDASARFHSIVHQT